MTTFTINADNNITAYPTLDHAEAAISVGAQAFTTEKQLAKIAEDWPIARLVDTWNGFAGVVPFDALKPVKKFENRAKAVARIWTAIQALAPLPAAADPVTPFDEPAAPPVPEATTKATRAKRPPMAPVATKTPAPAPEAKQHRAGTKREEAIRLLSRTNGATNQELQDAFGWQRHTVRGFICGALRKAGAKVENFVRANGDRAYRIAA